MLNVALPKMDLFNSFWHSSFLYSKLSDPTYFFENILFGSATTLLILFMARFGNMKRKKYPLKMIWNASISEK
ncbi:hypothetical protein A3Q56_04832 [Intoshia linei]|uniref:Uncharacterized protein n=1 Tax=Intoshia linei TaxID=1819745 RepID=A0A177AZ29_9BILA|nr:hypothetical protein A3Q56_04832 [Intoshia linei]